jgi:hypothetical protein
MMPRQQSNFITASALLFACLAAAAIASPASARDCSMFANDDARFRECVLMDAVANTVSAAVDAERMRVCLAQPRGQECRQYQAWEAERQDWLREKALSR